MLSMYLKTITTLGLTVDNVKNFLLELLSLGKSSSPIITRTTSILRHVHILGIVETSIG